MEPSVMQAVSDPIAVVREMLSASRVLAALFVLLLAWLTNRVAGFLARALAHRFGRYRMQITGLLPAVRLLVWVAAIYVVIVDIFQPHQSQLLALLASVGLAVGLAAQDLLRNVIAGVIILFERPFRVGDMVRIGEHYGEIVGIGLRSVSLHTFDDSLVTIPNVTATGQSVANSNSGALDEMVVASFTVPASLDVATVKALAHEAAACSPYVYLRKPITVLTEDLFDRTLLTRFTIKAYVLDVRYERLFASDMLERVKDSLRERQLVTPELVLSALAADRSGS